MLIYNAKIITNDSENPVIDDGAVWIENGLIKAIGTGDQLKAAYTGDERVDVEGRILMPGLINMHTHIYSAFARGMGVPRPQRNFPEILENVWWHLDRDLTADDGRLNAYATGIESIRNGVTTLFDHHSSPNEARGSLFAISDALSALGMRHSLCYEVSDRDGEAIFVDEVAENMDFMRSLDPDDNMRKAMFGLHASFTLSDKSLDKAQDAMSGRREGYHIHVAEGISDQTDSLQRYGKRVVERLNDRGMIGPNSLSIHCVNTNAFEHDILAATKANVVHNPMSNMGNAVGCTPVVAMLAKGVLVGLGTDAYTNCMLESVKVAKILQSHHLADPTKGFGEALTMQFENNPKMASSFFGIELGRLVEGAAADLITLDYKPYTPLTANTVGGHLVFGMTGRQVVDTMVNGRFVMKDRVIQTVDEDKLFAESDGRAREVWRTQL